MVNDGRILSCAEYKHTYLKTYVRVAYIPKIISVIVKTYDQKLQ